MCKDLRLAINPLFFSALVLNTQPLLLESAIPFLTALASGQTGWSAHAHSLTIKPGKWLDKESRNSQLDLSHDAMRDLLASALESMVNIHSVG